MSEGTLNALAPCLICQKGDIYLSGLNCLSNVDYNPPMYVMCNSCGASGYDIVDGYFYPVTRKSTLCTLYTPVKGFNVDNFKVGTNVKFKTIRGTEKEAEVLHIFENTKDSEYDQMIIQDLDTKRCRFIILDVTIADNYAELFVENKRAYSGWWSKRIDFI